MQDTDGKGFVTDDNSGGFFVAQCPECEAIFNSGDCEPDNSMAGDGEAWCPLCLDNGDLHEIEECDNANAVWNVQQQKINELQAIMSLHNHQGE